MGKIRDRKVKGYYLSSRRPNRKLARKRQITKNAPDITLCATVSHDHDYSNFSTPTSSDFAHIDMEHEIEVITEGREMSHICQVADLCDTIHRDHDYIPLDIPTPNRTETQVENGIIAQHLSNVDQDPEITLDGRRIVDINYLFKEIMKIGIHHPFDCSFADMYLISEKCMGINSIVTFKCKMCLITKSASLCDTRPDNVDINKGLVMGSISVGVGYSGCEELFTSMNIPFMAPATFYKFEDTVADNIYNLSWRTIEDAGKEEWPETWEKPIEMGFPS